MTGTNSRQRSILNLIFVKMQINLNRTIISFVGKQKSHVFTSVCYTLTTHNSVLVHSGDLTSGHYFAFVKPGKEDKW